MMMDSALQLVKYRNIYDDCDRFDTMLVLIADLQPVLECTRKGAESISDYYLI